MKIFIPVALATIAIPFEVTLATVAFVTTNAPLWLSLMFVIPVGLVLIRAGSAGFCAKQTTAVVVASMFFLLAIPFAFFGVVGVIAEQQLDPIVWEAHVNQNGRAVLIGILMQATIGAIGWVSLIIATVLWIIAIGVRTDVILACRSSEESSWLKRFAAAARQSW